MGGSIGVSTGRLKQQLLSSLGCCSEVQHRSEESGEVAGDPSDVPEHVPASTPLHQAKQSNFSSITSNSGNTAKRGFGLGVKRCL